MDWLLVLVVWCSYYELRRQVYHPCSRRYECNRNIYLQIQQPCGQIVLAFRKQTHYEACQRLTRGLPSCCRRFCLCCVQKVQSSHNFVHSVSKRWRASLAIQTLIETFSTLEEMLQATSPFFRTKMIANMAFLMITGSYAFGAIMLAETIYTECTGSSLSWRFAHNAIMTGLTVSIFVCTAMVYTALIRALLLINVPYA